MDKGIQIAMWINDTEAVARLQGIKNKKEYITGLIKRDIMSTAVSYDVYEVDSENKYNMLASFPTIEEARKYVLTTAGIRATGKIVITTNATYKNIKGGKKVC